MRENEEKVIAILLACNETLKRTLDDWYSMMAKVVRAIRSYEVGSGTVKEILKGVK